MPSQGYEEPQSVQGRSSRSAGHAVRHRASVPLVAALGLCGLCLPLAALAQSDVSVTTELSHMSLQQLSNLEVTSVSKAPQPLSTAPAAIYVITHDEIARSGATSLADALRLAPNLTVTQLSASNYSVAARGLGGNPNDQNFSNKLLMLIDGRSVYTPLFSGIYMDAQDVLLDDVDRIEIISGPGSTLWGANAVNGVINIITRSADETVGTLALAGGGNQKQRIASRYGDRLNEDTTYRLYGMGFQRDSEQLPGGASAQDSWGKLQGGFRLDWQHAADSAMLQGDLYRALEEQPDTQDQVVSGGDLLLRWQRQFSAQSRLQVQAYADQTERFAQTGNLAAVLQTYDLQVQDNVPIGQIQQLVWGGGERIYDYGIRNAAALLFVPSHRTLTLGNVFGHDTISLGHGVDLIAALKMEDDPYSGWSALPDVRTTWSPSARQFIWAAASRSIRSPTPFDVDVQEKVGPLLVLSGNGAFRPERLTAWQLGYRTEPTRLVSLSVQGFYNHYDDLRTVELSPGPALFRWGNEMRATTYGVELWAQLQLTSWWRLGPGVRTVHEDFRFLPSSSRLLGIAQAGNDPSYQASLTSSMDLPHQLSLDASLQYLSPLPDPALPGYYELMSRLAWQAGPHLRLSLLGQNLLHSRMLEYPAPVGEYIARSVMLEARYER